MVKDIELLNIAASVAKKSHKLFEFGDTFTFAETINRIEGLESELNTVSSFTSLSITSSLLLCNLVYLELDNENANLRLLGERLNLSRFELFKYKANFEELQNNLFVKFETNRNRSYEVYLQPETIIAFTTNNVQQLKRELVIDVNTFLEKIEYLNGRFSSGFLDSENADKNFNDILDTFSELAIVKKIKSFKVNDTWEVFMLCCIVSDHINYKNKFDWKSFLKIYHIRPTKVLMLVKLFINKQTDLFNENLIEFMSSDFDERASYIKLTEYASDIILGSEVCFAKHDFIPKHCKLITTDKINVKPLFFNETFNAKYQNLTEVLMNENYQQLTTKFNVLNLPPSITVILHGKPGTGKTESVYQIAKATNRPVLSVNISSMKDKFVGESEKKLQQLFANYRSALSFFNTEPILLFNEADAILGKRINTETSVDMMNNNLQNILLQEIEDFKGILIATTNNIHNIDKAFDRRFLYKLKYELPNESTKLTIWKNLLPQFDELDLMVVSEKFNLSGGQIQNVIKKLNTDIIIFNMEMSVNKIMEYCEEELNFRTNKIKIGF